MKILQPDYDQKYRPMREDMSRPWTYRMYDVVCEVIEKEFRNIRIFRGRSRVVNPQEIERLQRIIRFLRMRMQRTEQLNMIDAST